jgi:microtubule-associated protein-like 6
VNPSEVTPIQDAKNSNPNPNTSNDTIIIELQDIDLEPNISIITIPLQPSHIICMSIDSKQSIHYYQRQEIEVEVDTSIITPEAAAESPESIPGADTEPINTPEIVKTYQWIEQCNASELRDVWWSDWTTPYGWPVQGLWGDIYDGITVISTARSATYEQVPVLVGGDNYGRIRLFNYPSLSPNAPDKCYKGHFGAVNKVVFSYDDRYCMSIGNDRCILVWSTDILDEIRERKALQMDLSMNTHNYNDFNDSSTNTDALIPAKVFATPKRGDESLAVKPWKSAIREPSGHKDSLDLGNAPQASLELKFVYGYRGWDCRNNLGYAGSNNIIVYHIAAVGIVYNSDTHTQIHNTEHDDDIISLVCHPKGHSVASGEVGKTPKIVIWDAYTGVTIRTIFFHRIGVHNLAFSKCGNLLISAGLDDDRTVAVHNINTGALVGKGKAGKGVNIYTIIVQEDKFVTGGKNHIKFWEMPQATSGGGELNCKSGLYNNKAIKSRINVSAAFMGTDCVTGMSDGTLLVWKDRSANKFVKAHKGAIISLCELSEKGNIGGNSDSDTGPRIISGGRDGAIHIWSYKFVKIWSMDLSTTTPLSSNPEIRAISTLDDKLLIGTKASEIYEIDLLTTQVHRLCQGHFDERSELWGLTVHPSQAKFVTVGDDMTIRLWDAKNTRQINMRNLEKKARAVTYRNDGTHIAVACYDGHVKILSSDLNTVITQVTPTKTWIETIVYSPDSTILAVGSHDNKIYLLDTKLYSVRRICKGHSSFITNMDFSSDGQYLQSTSGAHELLFWKTKDGSRVTSNTTVRDVKWHTWTCTLGWPVQGIWPTGADNSDVNSTDRSPDSTLLATGDDFRRVKLFSYPCNKEHAKYKEYKGHSEHVPTIRFSKGKDVDEQGQYLYTVGGLDKAVMQFEVKQASKKKKRGALV